MSQQQNNNKFSEGLKRARGQSSQADFAVFLGIKSQQTYYNYEAGRIPKAPVLQQLSQRIGVSIPELLEGETPYNVMQRDQLVADGVDQEVATGLAGGPERDAARMADAELLEEIEELIRRYKESKPYMKAAYMKIVSVFSAELSKRHAKL